jgi:AAA family ATP:ADP antiporter
MLCAGTVTAQFVAGKAARDALFLANLDVTSLPAMVIATSIFSILLAGVSSRILRRTSPSTFVPLAFAASGLLLLAEWALAYSAPVMAARLVYLQISGVGPILGSGFWLIASEQFDPRTAKQRFGQIAGGGTLGGLLGGLLAERIAILFDIETMLVVLAVLNLVCAWQVRQLSHPAAPDAPRRRSSLDLAPELTSESPRSGLQVLARAPYLRNLAALVLLGTAAAALADYVFKLQAVRMFGSDENLLRFFAVYYAIVSLLTFAVQTASSRVALEHLGLAMTTGTPSMALLAGGVGALLAPGLESAMMARGGESVFRGSLFRSGYELFYTPIPVSEKRAAKSIIDVGFDRLGDGLGALLVRVVLIGAPLQHTTVIVGLAMACSALALIVASRLNRGYIQTLERSLLNRAVELDLSDVEDMTTRTTMLRTLTTLKTLKRSANPPRLAEGAVAGAGSAATPGVIGSLDTDMLQIMALRSRDRDRALRVLQSDEPLPASLVPHVIPLLAWDPVANEAVVALKRVAEERVGELIDALIDPNQDFAIRRRLARVFSICVSQRAADGVMLGLEDMRFEVRFQSARSLAAILEKNPRIRIDQSFIFEIVRRETAVGRPVWESQRLLHQLEDREEKDFFVDEFVKDRANRSLAHVFTLLSLVLPKEPLQIAFRGLHTDDRTLRGTALEYLEGVLPPSIRDRLWPYLEDQRTSPKPSRPREAILEDLLRSNHSIMINLEELKRRERGAPGGADQAPPGPSRRGGNR